MDPVSDAPASVEFGRFRIFAQRREVLADGRPMELGGRAFDVLAALAAASGETVSKDSLLDQVWPGLAVEENNLQVQMVAIRKALGDGWITTIPRRGYRLTMSPFDTAPPANLGSPADGGRPCIAVLPFTNMSGDADQEYFVDGMTEEIITALSRMRSLIVIARHSSFAYKGREVELNQVGQG